MKKFIRDNALAGAMFGFFVVFLVGLALTGHQEHNQELADHQQTAITLWQYIASGPFVEAVFENWESEFLQMGALVVLTVWLHQKGSRDSKKLIGKDTVDTSSRYSIIRAATWSKRRRALAETLYANSLSLALFGLFIVSFMLHAWGGLHAHNQESHLHGQATFTLWQYIGSAQFWYESFQNWQSEFLSVGMLIVLSIFLRQRGSPQSKPIGEPNTQTGS